MKLFVVLGLAQAQPDCTDVFYDGKTLRGFFMPEQRNTAGEVVDYEKCLYVSDFDKNWVESNAFCASVIPLGAACTAPYCKPGLASVHTGEASDAINDWIRDNMGTNGQSTYDNYWIALRKHCWHCNWAWDDLSPYSYQNWAKGEPDDNNNEDCVRAYEWPTGTGIGDYGKFTWNDENCGSGARFICQQYIKNFHKPTDPWLPSGQPNENGCPKGWIKYGGACYALFGDKNSDPAYTQKLGWEEANAQCGVIWQGASLAKMPNLHYQWFVTSLMAQAEAKSRGNPWIGILSEQQRENDHQFHWIDNTMLQFDNWAQNEPNGINDGKVYEDVVEMLSHAHGTGDAGQWIDNDRELKRAYLCSHETVSHEINQGNGKCPDGWLLLRHYCYKVSTSPLPFESARETCQSMAADEGKVGDLASVIDEYEFNVVRASLYPGLDTLTGNNVGEYPAAWIGLTAYRTSDDDIVFEWIDKSHMTVTYWAANQPNQKNIVSEPGKTCFFLDGPTGTWANSQTTTCATPLPYVCKMNLDNYTPHEEEDYRGELKDCPSGYIAADDRCLRGFTDTVNWFDAEESCTALRDLVSGELYGAHLASVHSDTKNTLLVNYYQSLFPQGGGMKEVFWAGAQRQGGSNQIDGMDWSDGSEFTFMKWDVGEPSFEWNGHAEDCLSVKGSGYWNDDHCDTDRHGYICQIGRQWSGCQGISINDTTTCTNELDDFITTERVCDAQRCCWNDGNCFRPKDWKPDSSGVLPSTLYPAIMTFLFSLFVI